MSYASIDIMLPHAKRVEWVGSSRSDVRRFPKDARERIGRELFRVQTGRLPEDWKPMRTVGAGVCEIRAHAGNEYRLIYVARFEEAVYALHAFQKRTQKTPQRDIELARRRLAEVIRKRHERQA